MIYWVHEQAGSFVASVFARICERERELTDAEAIGEGPKINGSLENQPNRLRSLTRT